MIKIYPHVVHCKDLWNGTNRCFNVGDMIMAGYMQSKTQVAIIKEKAVVEAERGGKHRPYTLNINDIEQLTLPKEEFARFKSDYLDNMPVKKNVGKIQNGF